MEVHLNVKCLLVCLLFIAGCGNIQPETHRILIIYDVTGTAQDDLPDAGKVLKDISKIYNIMDKASMGDYVYDGFDIGITFFDELSDARVAHKSMPPAEGSAATVNPKKRQRLLREFAGEVQQMIETSLASTTIDRPKSKIYARLCKALGKETQKLFSTRHVIIYSDLLENSELANFYRPATLKKAAENPLGFAREHFFKFCEPGDLNGVTIHLYPYRTAKTDVLINHAEKFWVTLFEEAGAEVLVNP